MSEYKDTIRIKQELIEHAGDGATEFDFETVEAALAGLKPMTPDESQRLDVVTKFILDWLFTVDLNDARALKSIGRRAVAMAWVLEPERFKAADSDQPSLRQLSRQLGFTAPNIAPLTSEFSRLTKIFNKFQKHDSRSRPKYENN